MTIIHFIRHGEVHNPRRVLYARLPRFPLSAAGWGQAEAAAAYLRDRPLAAVIASPRLRARQTAAIIARPHGLPVRTSRLIDEIHTPHQGRPLAELDGEGWRLFANLPPGYESPAGVTARAVRLINRLRRRYQDGEVAVVTHGDVVLAVRFWVEGIPFTDDTKNAAGLYPATASITTLTFPPSDNGTGKASADRPAMTYHRPY